MTTPENRCPDESELFVLLDEPESAGAVAEHVTTCAACRAKRDELALAMDALRQPVRAYDADAFVARLEREIRRQPSHGPVVEPRRARLRRVLYLAGGALAVAATIALVPRLAHRGDTEIGELTARGLAVEAGAARDVDLSLDVVERDGKETTVTSAASKVRVPASAHLLLSYATRSAQRPFHLLCFAVDASSEVHWLYPAFEDASTDPESIALLPGTPSTPMSTEALLDDLPPGRTRVFALLSPRPMHVSDVEHLDESRLHTSGLEARFPDADVRAWELSIEGPSP